MTPRSPTQPIACVPAVALLLVLVLPSASALTIEGWSFSDGASTFLVPVGRTLNLTTWEYAGTASVFDGISLHYASATPATWEIHENPADEVAADLAWMQHDARAAVA